MISGHLLWEDKLTDDMLLVKHRDRYCLTYPDLPQNMYESLQASAAARGDKIAIVDEFGREFCYADLLARTDAFAALLVQRYAIRKGVRVGFLLYNSVEFAVVFFALCKLGAVSVPLPTKYRAKEVTSLMEKARLKVLVYDSEFESAMADACERLGVTGLSCPFGENVYGLEPGLFKEAPLVPPRISVRRSVSARSGGSRSGLNDDCILMFTSGTTSQS